MSTNPLNDISRVYLEQVVSVDEGYKPIDREKESAMYRRAGNLARTSLSSRGKKKEEAQTKSANIVRAITSQKEKERFDRIGQSPSHNEEAKPDYLDFDKDGNKKEPMKKALKDKAKKKNLEEAGGRQGGGTIRPPKPQSGSPTPPTSTDRAAVRFGKKTIEEAKKPNDGNLANNYPPYDKVTRGDVIAGRLGKDEMGGKKKAVKEGFSNWREDLREVMSKVEKENNDVKITEKKVDNKIKTSAMGGGIELGEAIEGLGGTLLDIVELDEKINLKKTKMGDVIRDFYTSDAPQFKGRSKAKRREMAIAAKLEAEGGVKEAVSDVTPLSPQELQVQRQKAQLDARLAILRRQSFSKMKKPEVVSGSAQEVQKESTAKRALGIIKANMGPGLMTGPTKKEKLTPEQKKEMQDRSNAYVERTSREMQNNTRGT